MGPPIALQLPKIDFSGLELKKRGSDGWDTVMRSQVLGGLHRELRNELFGTAAKELVGLPVETKMQNVSYKSLHGYIGQIPGWAYESLVIDDAPLLQGSQAFTNLMHGLMEDLSLPIINAGNEKRYSVGYGVNPKDGYLVQAPEELVDEEHPRLYEPYDYSAYLQFCFSGGRRESTSECPESLLWSGNGGNRKPESPFF
uniref:Probable 2-oxoglutarate-dependent dioxygenase AOP1.2 n=1 Tax=Elaeis guineensis var. tenera TaxID=51953 RepID=A0A8N4F001_ELAGV|nr:probable 2-oxoglutarate-dependent dioxygenase AOP1.2 [Elaeis guineensis]